MLPMPLLAFSGCRRCSLNFCCFINDVQKNDVQIYLLEVLVVPLTGRIGRILGKSTASDKELDVQYS